MKLNDATGVAAELPLADTCRLLGVDVQQWQRDLLNGVDLRTVHIRKQGRFR